MEFKRWHTFDSEGRPCHPYIKNDGMFFKAEDVLPLLRELERWRHPLLELPSAVKIAEIMHDFGCDSDKANDIYFKSEAKKKRAIMRMQELDGEKP